MPASGGHDLIAQRPAGVHTSTPMKIQFLGATRTVTGSAHFIEVSGKRILLDCGLFQGRRDEARQRNLIVPDAIKTIDAVVLSHGHLDHCGRLPILLKRGYTGPIWCTEATRAVSRTVLHDSAELQVEDAKFLNRRARGPADEAAVPLYTPDDVSAIMPLFKTTALSQRVDLGNGVGFTFFEAGHILGSAYVWLDWKDDNGRERRLLFTADVGRYNTPIINDPAPPPGPADLVITESTYGARHHEPMTDVEPEFLKLIQQIIETKARLLVPSFAVARTQTMLWYIQKFVREGKIPQIRTYIDSPMGVEVTHTYANERESYDQETRELIGSEDLFGVKGLTLASNANQSKQINSDKGPCVIIASSPTCEFGRILHHLSYSVERPQDVVLFVGWTPPETLGRRLQNGETRIRIFDRWYDVRCQIQTLAGMSAHADGDELVQFLKPAFTDRTRAFVVHGEPDQSEVFATRLVKELQADGATVPAAYSTFFI